MLAFASSPAWAQGPEDLRGGLAVYAYYDTHAAYAVSRSAGAADGEEGGTFALAFDRFVTRVAGDIGFGAVRAYFALQANPLAPDAPPTCGRAGDARATDERCRAQFLEVAKAGLALGAVQWEMGRDTIQQSAFESADTPYDPMFLSAYARHFLPFRPYQEAATVKVNGASQQWSLQITNDPVTRSLEGERRPQRQPAPLGQWRGRVGDADTLAQVGSFAQGRARFLALGARWGGGDAGLTVNVHHQKRNRAHEDAVTRVPEATAIHVAGVRAYLPLDMAFLGQASYVALGSRTRLWRAMAACEFPWRPRFLQMYVGLTAEGGRDWDVARGEARPGTSRETAFVVGMKGDAATAW